VQPINTQVMPLEAVVGERLAMATQHMVATQVWDGAAASGTSTVSAHAPIPASGTGTARHTPMEMATVAGTGIRAVERPAQPVALAQQHLSIGIGRPTQQPTGMVGGSSFSSATSRLVPPSSSTAAANATSHGPPVPQNPFGGARPVQQLPRSTSAGPARDPQTANSTQPPNTLTAVAQPHALGISVNPFANGRGVGGSAPQIRPVPNLTQPVACAAQLRPPVSAPRPTGVPQIGPFSTVTGPPSRRGGASQAHVIVPSAAPQQQPPVRIPPVSAQAPLPRPTIPADIVVMQRAGPVPLNPFAVGAAVTQAPMPVIPLALSSTSTSVPSLHGTTVPGATALAHNPFSNHAPKGGPSVFSGAACGPHDAGPVSMQAPSHEDIELSEEALAQILTLEQAALERSSTGASSSNNGGEIVLMTECGDSATDFSEADLAHLMALADSNTMPPVQHKAAAETAATNMLPASTEAQPVCDDFALTEEALAQLMELEQQALNGSTPATQSGRTTSIAIAANSLPGPSSAAVTAQQSPAQASLAPLLCMRLVALDVVDNHATHTREVRAFQPGGAAGSGMSGKHVLAGAAQEILTVELSGDW
jgi:hypothetical protein